MKLSKRDVVLAGLGAITYLASQSGEAATMSAHPAGEGYAPVVGRVWWRVARSGPRTPLLLLHGGDADANGGWRGGEICACFGVSCAAVEMAIADGAASLDAIGAVTRAGTNCGSCRPEIRALVRAARPRKAAGKAAQKAA